MDTIPEPELPTDPATDWLEDHLDLLPQLPTLLAGTAVQHGPSVVITAATAAGVLFGTRAAVRRWRNLRHAQNTRLIEAAVPPQVEEASAAAWWKHLAGHLAPRWKRLVYGQPHVAFEYVADANGVRFQVWVPGTISPGVVEKAVQAAWPGCTITTRPAIPPVPLDAATAGGRLVLGNAEHLPLKHDHEADPLRPLLEAMAGLRKGEHAAVQILARPCTGRRLRHAYRAASQLRGGRSKGLQATIFDSITPGQSGDHARPTPSEIAQSYPERAKQVQAILAKAGQSRFEVQIRYAVGTSRQPHPGKAQDFSERASQRRTHRRIQGKLRARAHELASTFALYSSGHQHLQRRRLHAPAVCWHPGTSGRDTCWPWTSWPRSPTCRATSTRPE